MWKGNWSLISVAALLCAAACGDDDEGGEKVNGASGSSGSDGVAGAAGSGEVGEGGNTSSTGSAGEQGTAAGPAIHGTFLPEFESGTRLTVKQYQFEDMPPVFLSFYDNELETECTFVDVDGTLRCMPSEQNMIREVLFADASCGDAVVTRPTDCGASAAAPWFVEREPLGEFCAGTLPHAFHAVPLEVGDPLFVDDGGTCTEQGAVDDTRLWYRLEPETPAADFVAGEAVVDESAGLLSVRRIVADDGASVVEGIYDTDAPGLCRIREYDLRWICVPEVGFHSEGYRNMDADCSEPLSLASCSEPLYLLSGGDVIHRAGPEYTGTVYGGVGDMCEEVPAGEEDGTYYEVGELVEPGEFAPLDAVRQGTQRLQRDVYVDSAGMLMMPGGKGIFDMDLAAYCSPLRAMDGSVYCVPAEVPIESTYNLYYADADCTEQLSYCGMHDCPHEVALQTDPNTACGSDFDEVLALGDEFTGGELYIWYSGREPGMECDGPFPTDDYGTLRRVEGEGTLEAFAELELVTE
ncbi:MAG TPA: hypothetical protein VM686_00755 [Polyangiaceae bacterium]|nr:hypothetical protein [Polyangiaceae bacterium]